MLEPMGHHNSSSMDWFFTDFALNTKFIIGGSYSKLPPANEVWGKVIFFTCICHSVNGGVGLTSQHGSHVT